MKGRKREAPLDHRVPLSMKGVVLGVAMSLVIWLILIRIVEALLQ